MDDKTVIVAMRADPQPWEYGLVYFDECDWPKPGYTLIKRVTGCTKAELTR